MQLSSERLGRGTRTFRPTIIDVAKAAGVSKSTVSRVIRGDHRVAPGTREMVQQAIDDLNYVPTAAAQQMRAAAAPSIGLLISAIDIPIHARLNLELHAQLGELGFHIVQETMVDMRDESIRAQLNNILGLRVQGILVASGAVRSETLRGYSAQIPLVVVGRDETDELLNNVAYDAVHNGRLLVEHLHRLGHRSIVVQTQSKKHSMGSWARANAAVERARELGITVDVVNPDETPDLEGWVREIADSGVTAVMCVFDRWLLETWRAARRAGVDVPRDLSLTGSDGIMDGVDLLGLTTVRMPVEAVAHRSAELIVDLIQHPRAVEAGPVREKLRGHLLEGSTVAAPRG